MNYTKHLQLIGNALLAAGILIVDQLTKWYVLVHCRERVILAPGVAFHLTFNRGVSWSLLSSESYFWFGLVSALVAIITAIVAYIGFCRFTQGRSIIAQTCMVAGSCANLIDRFVHGGVIDFISLFWGSWYFAIFNIADICIVSGVFLFVIQSFWEQKKSKH